MIQGKLNAYATTMAGRPIMRSTTTTQHYTKRTTQQQTNKEDKPIIITTNHGWNLWQWFRKYCGE